MLPLKTLIDDADHLAKIPYQEITSSLALGLPLKPKTVNVAYFDWLLIPNILPTFFSGVHTSRDDFLVDIHKDILETRILEYFNPEISNEEISKKYPSVVKSDKNTEAFDTRKKLIKEGIQSGEFMQFTYRPFDVRWLYWEPKTKLLDRNRAEYKDHVFTSNVALVSQQKPRRDWSTSQVTSNIGCFDLMDRGASYFPLKLKTDSCKINIYNNDPRQISDDEIWNLSDQAVKYAELIELESQHFDLIFYHINAILYSTDYQTENLGALKQDWPRIPLPNNKKHLQQSAQLGQQLAALLDPETPVPGVTQTPSDPLKIIAVPTTTHSNKFKPEDFALTANWGYGGNGKPTMPGKGKAIQRPYTPTERETLGSDRIARLGEHTYDIYLNDRAYWCNIPDRVWHYTLGGYQVIKKWLSYRAEKIIDRPLKQDELIHVIHTARRLAAILLLEPDLDANYHTIKTNRIEP
jgi:hypothetical protein